MPSNQTISFSFCISDNYAQHLSVVLTSLLVNNPDVQFVFHVLHRGVLPETEMRVRLLEKMYPNHRIVFHRIDARAFDKFPIPKTLAHITQETYYRYLLPEVLRDEERTIYSDVDVLCVGGDVRELWNMDLQGRPMAGIRKVKKADILQDRHLEEIGLAPGAPTFFAGMLVMDLVALRGERFTEACMAMTAAKLDKLVFADMDVINLVMQNRMSDIDPRWNMLDRYSFFREGVFMWHFVCQTQKPWCCLWKNITWLPYMKYLMKTPYRGNVFLLIWQHVRGVFFFTYTKNRVKRYLILGVRVWKKRV